MKFSNMSHPHIVHKVQKSRKNIMNSIATLGSHCSLQVLKGAKDEGLKTLLVCEKDVKNYTRDFHLLMN